jgi:hypothetical protein
MNIYKLLLVRGDISLPIVTNNTKLDFETFFQDSVKLLTCSPHYYTLYLKSSLSQHVTRVAIAKK